MKNKNRSDVYYCVNHPHWVWAYSHRWGTPKTLGRSGFDLCYTGGSEAPEYDTQIHRPKFKESYNDGMGLGVHLDPEAPTKHGLDELGRVRREHGRQREAQISTLGSEAQLL